MNERFVVGNWKLNKTCQEARDLLAQLKSARVFADVRLRCVVAPPATALFASAQVLQDSPIMLCAQNINATDAGAFTGEVSGPLVYEAGAHFVLVGHSERRSLFAEDDAAVAQKLAAAAKAGLTPILCIGETTEQRRNNQTRSTVQQQLRAGAAAYLAAHMGPLVVAYEPVWAIGTGATAAPADAQAVHEVLQETLTALGPQGAPRVPLLYGGSVTAANAASFVAQNNIDGVLVGGASLSAESFVAIAQAVCPP